nr:hypothetical protein CTI12_AA501740 [Tanacetum cinerariifolium]
MYHPQRAPPPQNQSSPIPIFNLNDDNLEPLWDSASQPSQYMEEDENLSRSVTKSSLLWTIEEEVALCKAWVSGSEDSIEGNGKKVIRVLDGTDSKDVNVQEVAPMGRDRAKKKASSYGPRSKTSISESELELEDQKRWEQGELKGLKIAKRDKELDLQQKIVRISTTTKMGGGHQLDIARKITSIALSTRVSSLESESSILQQHIAARDDVIVDLESKLHSLDFSLSQDLHNLSLADHQLI